MPFTFLDRIETFTSLHKLTKDSIKDIKQPVSTSFGSIILSEEDIKVKSCIIELLNNTNVCHELVPEFFFFTVLLSKPKNDNGTEKESVSASKMGKVADRIRLQNEKSTRKRLLFSELARLDRSNLGFKQSGTTKTRQLQQLRSKIVTATF